MLDSTSGILMMQWEAVPSARSYDILIRPAGSLSAFQPFSSLDNFAILSLRSCLKVEVKIKADCSNEFSPVHLFTTACPPCTAPVSQSVIATHSNSIDLDVKFPEPVSAVQGLKFEFRAVGESVFETIEIRNNIFTQNLRDTIEITGLTDNTAYEARISQLCIFNNLTHEVVVASEPSPLFSFTTLPIRCRPPTSVAVTADKNNATVNWQSGADATSFQVDFREAGTSSFSRVETLQQNAALAGLKAGTTYELKVRSICNGEPSAFSPIFIFTTLPPDCTVPVNLIAESITENSAILRWAAVPTAISYTIEYRLEDGIPVTETASANSRSITGLLPGKGYLFKVRANCPGSGSEFSVPAGFATLELCLSPENLNVTDITHNFARINWNEVSNAISYDCRFRKTGTSVFTRLSASGSTVSLGGLEPSTTYDVEIQTVCQGNISTGATAIRFTTSEAPPCIVPSGITISNVQATSVTLLWNGVQGALSYNIRFRPAGTESFTTATSFVTSKGLLPLIPATTYEVSLQTVCDGKTSDFTLPLVFTTAGLCDTITNLQLVSASHEQAILEWRPSAGALGYTVQFRPVSSPAFTILSTSENTITLSALQPSTTYEVRVQSQCNSSNSAFSSLFRFTTQPQPPCNVVTGLLAESVTTQSAVLRWQASENATGYKIDYFISGTTVITTAFSGAASVSISNLLPGKQYAVLVRPICGSVQGDPSDTLFFTTLLPCVATPAIRADVVTRTTATLSWDEVPVATGYVVLFNVLGSTAIESRNTTSSTIILENLLPGTDYQVRVQSVCQSGNANSGIFQFRTQDAIPCVVPAGLSQGNITSESAELNWQAATASSSYLVEFREAGSSVVSTRTTTITNIRITGLRPQVTYEFRVRSICGSDSSLFSNAILVSTPGTCNSPENVTVRAITPESASVSWNAVTAANSYKLQFRKSGETNFTEVAVTGNAHTISGLLQGTAYEVQVLAICTNATSNFSPPVNFSTSLRCEFPPGFTAVNITETSALLSWGFYANGDKKNIEFRKSGEAEFTSITIHRDSTTRILTGLQPGTAYEARIRSVCSGEFSPFSSLIRFTTRAARCGTPAMPVVASVTATTATLNWPIITGAVRYVVRYRIVGANSFTTVSTTTNTVTIEGLSAINVYEASVQAVCASLTTSFGPSALVTVTCPALTQVRITELPSGEISIAFDQNSIFRSYQVKVEKASLLRPESAKLLNFTTNPFVTTKAQLGITTGTGSPKSGILYRFRVMGICQNGALGSPVVIEKRL